MNVDRESNNKAAGLICRLCRIPPCSLAQSAAQLGSFNRVSGKGPSMECQAWLARSRRWPQLVTLAPAEIKGSPISCAGRRGNGSLTHTHDAARRDTPVGLSSHWRHTCTPMGAWLQLGLVGHLTFGMCHWSELCNIKPPWETTWNGSDVRDRASPHLNTRDWKGYQDPGATSWFSKLKNEGGACLPLSPITSFVGWGMPFFFSSLREWIAFPPGKYLERTRSSQWSCTPNKSLYANPFVPPPVHSPTSLTDPFTGPLLSHPLLPRGANVTETMNTPWSGYRMLIRYYFRTPWAELEPAYTLLTQ